METVGSPGTEREPTPRPRIKLRKHARQIRVCAAATHVRRVGRAVLVLAKIVPFAPTRIRKHRVTFGDQLELFLIATLETKKGKSSESVPVPKIQKKGRKRKK